MISYVSLSVLCMDVVDAVNLEIACSLCSVVSLVEYCAETCKVIAPAGNRQEHSVRLCHPFVAFIHGKGVISVIYQASSSNVHLIQRAATSSFVPKAAN